MLALEKLREPDALEGELMPMTVCPNVFTMAQERVYVPYGMSIAEMIEFVQPDSAFARYAHVTIGPDYIPMDMWSRVRPKPGACLTVRFVPGKGGGKNPFSIVLTLALAVVAPYLGVALAGALGVGAVWIGSTVILGSTIMTTVVGAVGTLAIHSLFPPPKAKSSSASSASSNPAENPTLFISGAQNQELPYGKVPYVLGKTRLVPPMMRPYTETVGSDQYVRMLFIWGFGPLQIQNFKIGETLLSQFTDYEIETRYGYPTDTPITLYSNSVIQDDLSIDVTYASGYSQRVSELGANELSADFTFQQGLCKIDDKGKRVAATVVIETSYCLVGTTAWVTNTYTYSAAQQNALRKNVRYIVPVGQYNFRVRRLTGDTTSDTTFDDVTWSTLRTVRYTAPVAMPGIAMTAIRMKATGQLNGVIDQFNAEVQSILPTWNGNDWNSGTAPTSNPAAIFRAILQGPGNARALPDSRVNLTDLGNWYNNCVATGREYNYPIASEQSVQQTLQDVAACGRAAVALFDGRWTVIQDVVKTVPTQHFTPRNSFGFSGGKTYPDSPHAFRVQFQNRDNGWVQDEIIVYDDGYSKYGEVAGTVAATKFETLPLTGVTSVAQAWKDGRYHIATVRLRPETYMLTTDIEHIACTRGDLVKVSHDVALFGIGWARIKSITLDTSGNIVQFGMDDQLTMDGVTLYGVRIRAQDGTSYQYPIVTGTGSYTTLTLVTPAPNTGPQVGDMISYGVRGQETVDMLVKSIEPQAADLSAKITMVDYAPALFNVDTGTIPAFTSQITVPTEFIQPPAPAIASVQLGDEVLIINSDGTFKPSIVISLSAPNYNNKLTPVVLLRQSDENSFHPATFTATGNLVIITDVSPGSIYDISLTYENASGTFSLPTVLTGQLVTGGTFIPDNVTGFSANILSGVAHASWDAPLLGDILYYTIKFNPALTGAVWSNSYVLVDQIPPLATSCPMPALVGTYLIRAVNANGSSLLEDVIVNTVPANTSSLIVNTVEEDPSFSGTKTNVVVSSGGLQLATGTALGTYTFSGAIDLGAVFRASLLPILTVEGEDTSTSVDSWPNVDAIQNWDGNATPDQWGTQFQLRTTNDNPAGTPTWSAWQNFAFGDYSARGFQFQVVLESYAANITPYITALGVKLQMSANVVSGSLTSNASDAPRTHVTFSPPFKVTPSIGITGQAMQTGDTYTRSNESPTGFDIVFNNSAGTRVTRNFDYSANGFGIGSS